MNLVASLIVRNERGRYLKPCIDHLLDFCDLVAIVDDASDDDTRRWLFEHPDKRVRVDITNIEPEFYAHEGHARQHLLDWTLAMNPTHVLSLDADEFVSDGAGLRARLEADPNIAVWTLSIEEIWEARADALRLRIDGGWRTHPLACCWRAPALPSAAWKMMDKQLACRRVPMPVLSASGRARDSQTSLLHVGWSNKSERQRRHARYAQHDQGRFHARAHLDSIMWDDRRVTLRDRAWPAGLETYREDVLAAANKAM